MSQLTPMMQQYFQLKEKHKESILFFRMGDFYEMFGEDARTGAKELEITLTARNRGEGEKIPMAGVPVKAADAYIARLIKKGYRVAIGEQLEDPKESRGLVARDVIRVITPGTITEENLLPDSNNNYLAAITGRKGGFGLAHMDISTGEFRTTQMAKVETLLDEILRIRPAEVLLAKDLPFDDLLKRTLEEELTTVIKRMEEELTDDDSTVLLTDFFNTVSLQGFGLKEYPAACGAAALIILYLKETQKGTLKHITHLSTYNTSRYMELDQTTRRNLELTETIREKKKEGSLLWLLDKTVTAMGGRTLRQRLEQPLLDRAAIEERLTIVGELKENLLMTGLLKEHLKGVFDLPRLLSRISIGRANPRDLLALKQSLQRIPPLKKDLDGAESIPLKRLKDSLDPLVEVVDLIHRGVKEDAPLTTTEGDIIKEGFHEELDGLRSITQNGREWIAALEKTERERTGISSLKVRYNRVFGYYLEVTKSNLEKVPPQYQRKQTLSNSERFITPELKEKEDQILRAEEKITHLEYQLFTQLREAVAAYTQRIQKTAQSLSLLDVYQSFAQVAAENNYCRPLFNKRDRIIIKTGRHPVIEESLKKGDFIPNDTHLDSKKNRFLMITGPNMSGKSTYMRQVALIILMAQLGSFVPAKEASLRITDRIFTRVGASDDLATGQSTFMVEMNEVANILHNSTPRSLILLDEVGRGTATFDGLSIAWAITEYLVKRKGGMTLFATHYHELTDLAKRLEGIKNYQVAVQEKEGRILFLHHIIPGKSDESYGIEVARLAGLPGEIIKRAGEILENLKKEEKVPQTRKIEEPTLERPQLSLFMTDTRIKEALKKIDVQHITPIEAMNHLHGLKKMVEEE